MYNLTHFNRYIQSGNITVKIMSISSVSLCIHLLVDIWFVSNGLLQIQLRCTFIYIHVCEDLCSFRLDKHAGVKWLDHLVGVCLTSV